MAIKLGVRVRLLAGLAALTMTTVAASGVALVVFAKVNRDLAEVADTYQPSLIAAASLAQTSQQIEADARSLAGARQRFAQDGVIFRIRGSLDQLGHLIATLEGAGADPAAMAELHQARDALSTGVEALYVSASRVIDGRDAQMGAVDRVAAVSGGLGALTLPADDTSTAWREAAERIVDELLAGLAYDRPQLVTRSRGRVAAVSAKLAQAYDALPETARTAAAPLHRSLVDLAGGADAVLTARLRVLGLHNAAENALTRTTALSEAVKQQAGAVVQAINARTVDNVATLRAVIASRSDLLVAIAAACLIGALATLAYIQRSIVRRLALVHRALGERVAGRPAPIPRDGGDEIGDIGRALHFFVGEIDRRETALRTARDEAEDALGRLAAAHRHLSEANRSIEDGIRYARRIQSSLLPAADAHAGLLADLAVGWYPRDIVSGDYYWYGRFGDRCVLVLMDCTGHGVPGAFMTALAATLLTRTLESDGHDDPAAILTRLHRLMQGTLRQGGDAQSNDGLDAAICVVEPERRRLRFAGARLPLLLHDGEGFTLIKGDRSSIGYGDLPADLHFTRHEVTLTSGTRIYLATDGILDQIGGARRRAFGMRRLMAILEPEQPGEPLGRQRERLFATLDDWRGEEEWRDDLTFLAFQPLAGPATAEARPRDDAGQAVKA